MSPLSLSIKILSLPIKIRYAKNGRSKRVGANTDSTKLPHMPARHPPITKTLPSTVLTKVVSNSASTNSGCSPSKSSAVKMIGTPSVFVVSFGTPSYPMELDPNKYNVPSSDIVTVCLYPASAK